MQRFPETGSLGIYNCRNVAGSSSLSIHSCGRAADSKIPTGPGGAAIPSIGNPVVLFLSEFSTQFGIIAVIYNEVIYDDASPRGRRYGGVHPHKDHVHWEHTMSKALSLTYADIVEIAGPATGGDNQGGIIMLPITPTSSREDIRLLQLDMNFGIGTGLVPDGIYGPATAGEVKKWLTPSTGADESGDSEVANGTKVNAKMWQTLQSEVINKHIKNAGASGSSGVTIGQMETAISAHAKTASSGTVHPHKHDEGATGGAIS
jgi:hypothetical protein